MAEGRTAFLGEAKDALAFFKRYCKSTSLTLIIGLEEQTF